MTPIKPVLALAETACIGAATAGLFVSWTQVEPTVAEAYPDMERLARLIQLVQQGTDAFGISLSVVWSREVSPIQPRIGPILLTVAIAAAVLAWVPAASRFRTIRMIGLLGAAGVPVAVIARAVRLDALDALGPGTFLTAAGFALAALFAAALLRIPIYVMLSIVILGGFALVGAFVAGRPFA